MIRVDHLTVRAGLFRLDDVTFEVPTGTHGVLMGKTGSGKTTVLEAICGLKSIQAGSICLMDRDVTRLKPALRGIGYVPQDAALFPHLTVAQHLGFALAIRKAGVDVISRRVEELAAMLSLTHLLPRKPQGLSGGEAQRVALGRALANHPRVLCLDEPLASLDEETRDEMCGMLRRVRSETGVTVLHVTHSLSEARALADHIFQLRDGRVSRLDGVSPR